MKKVLILLFIFSMFTVSLNIYVPYITASNQADSIFARVKYNNVYLYETPSQEIQNNVYFILEQSYFVELLNDDDENFYEAKYIDIIGFVKKSQVEIVENSPQTPYLSGVTFNTSENSSSVLRSTPNLIDDTTALKVLEPNTNNIKYYGKLAGEELTAGLGNVWYYCKYEDELNNQIAGYIYSPLTYNLTPITQNNEVIRIMQFSPFNKINAFLNINPHFHFVIIILTILPSVVIISLFFKKSKV
jgi:hypothetical protein